jgi:hypothetical protein
MKNDHSLIYVRSDTCILAKNSMMPTQFMSHLFSGIPSVKVTRNNCDRQMQNRRIYEYLNECVAEGMNKQQFY